MSMRPPRSKRTYTFFPPPTLFLSPAVQNHGEWSRNSFDFAIDTPGFVEIEWHQASLDIEKDVAFGDGKIVNIAGYRTVTQRSLTDFDGTTRPIFNVGALVDQHQLSNELR